MKDALLWVKLPCWLHSFKFPPHLTINGVPARNSWLKTDRHYVAVLCHLLKRICTVTSGFTIDLSELKDDDTDIDVDNNDNTDREDDDTDIETANDNSNSDKSNNKLTKKDVKVHAAEFAEMACQPSSLQWFCVVKIRQHLRVMTIDNYKKLGLPQKLMSIVTLSSLADELNELKSKLSYMYEGKIEKIYTVQT